MHLQKEKNLIISFFEISLIFQFSTNFIINDSSINQSATNSSITSNERDRDLTTRAGKEKKKKKSERKLRRVYRGGEVIFEGVGVKGSRGDGI